MLPLIVLPLKTPAIYRSLQKVVLKSSNALEPHLAPEKVLQKPSERVFRTKDRVLSESIYRTFHIEPLPFSRMPFSFNFPSCCWHATTGDDFLVLKSQLLELSNQDSVCKRLV